MGKVFGGLALVFGIIFIVSAGLIIGLLPYGASIMYTLFVLVIISGIIGIVTDDSKGLAIAGLIFGIVGIVITVIFVDLWGMILN